MQTAVEPLPVSRARALGSAWTKSITVGIAVTIFSAVLAFGATQPSSIFAFEIASGLLFLACWTSMVLRRDFTALRTPLMAPIALFAAVVGLQAIFGWTAYTAATQAEGLRYAAYFCVFVSASHVFRDKSLAKTFLNALIIFGSVVAVEAIAQDLSAPGLIYWRVPAPASGTIFGPFVSHGLYAGFMEMVAGVAIVKWLTMKTSEPRWLLWGFCTTVTSVSIVMSRSRAGMLALAVQLIFAAFLLLRRSDGASKPMVIASLALAAALAVWLGSFAVLHGSTSFFDALNKDINGHRLTITADCWKMFRQKPIFGWGLDAFPVVYPRFRSFATDAFINEAQNDYLQILVETGIAGATAVVLFIVTLFVSASKRLTRRRDSLNWVVAGTLVGCTGMIVHSAFDFTFHITADAALFYVLAAIVATPRTSRLRGPEQRAHVLDLTSTEES